jgi:dolichol kinase
MTAVLLAESLEYITGAGNYYSIDLHGGVYSLVFPLIGYLAFPLFYVAGLLFGWYHISAGLNSWLDLGEAIAIAGLGYAIAEAIIFTQKKAIDRLDETPRKTIHVISNLSACVLIWIFGIQTISYFILIGTYAGILLMHITMSKIKLPGIEQWIKNVGREGENPGEGALYNALGILFAIGILRGDVAAAISVILILALGDGLATFVGTKYGKHKLPWNRNKSLEGTIGFVAGAMCALFIMPVPATIFIAVLAAFIESLPIKVNDNIALPVVTSLLCYFLI